MFLELLRIAILLAIALVYALFDLLNKREVPDIFVYASFLVGLALAFTYPANTLIIDLLIAVIIASFGYVIYRAGYWGAGDLFEITTISLILPIQPKPWLVSLNQLGLPFVISFFISSGIAAIWIVPIYYLAFKKKQVKKTGNERIYRTLGIILLALYLVLLLFIYFVFGISIVSFAIIAAIGIPSAVVLAYEEEITGKMIDYVHPSKIQQGDIIAINMMSREELAYFRRIYPNFSRLATKGMIQNFKRLKTRKKLPVYAHAVPFAVFVLIGVVISLLFGNIVLFLLQPLPK